LKSAIRTALPLLMSAFLVGCATLSPGYEEPTVTLSSFRALPGDGMAPAFEIGLRVINPNAQAIALEGVVYTINVQGHELVKGVGKDFPVIEGYSQQDLVLTASANLLSGIRFIADMMQAPAEKLAYEFEAKLDLRGLYPSIRVSERGTFDLNPSAH
jgi:hypothetical protein